MSIAEATQDGGLDPETDTSRARFVTRASVQACWIARNEARRRKARPVATVPFAEDLRFTGLGRRAIVDLVRQGVLEELPGRRTTCGITAASLEAWLAGQRFASDANQGFTSTHMTRSRATLRVMEIGPGVDLDDEMVYALVRCGHEGHRVARAHHNDPGSNGFTFGTDRYQRSTELAADVLRDRGFSVTRRGAGLIARREGLELQFAVARGTDLSDPASFDADSSPARRRAGATNATQLAFDGLPQLDAGPIVHVVWSGTQEAGQTAVHAGRLVAGAGDHLDWSVLVRLDEPVLADQPGTAGAAAASSYADQPEPALLVAARFQLGHADEA